MIRWRIRKNEMCKERVARRMDAMVADSFLNGERYAGEGEGMYLYETGNYVTHDDYFKALEWENKIC